MPTNVPHATAPTMIPTISNPIPAGTPAAVVVGDVVVVVVGVVGLEEEEGKPATANVGEDVIGLVGEVGADGATGDAVDEGKLEGTLVEVGTAVVGFAVGMSV